MARAPGKKKLAELADWTLRYKRSREALDRYYRAMEREYNYALKMEHHEAPKSKNGVRTPAPLQVSTLDLYDIVRYSSSEIGGASSHIDVRSELPGKTPQEQAELDDACRIARAVVMDWAADTDLGYPDVKRAIVRLGEAARAGAIMLDVCPGGKRGAEIVPRVVDPQNLSWDVRYSHFNKHGNKVLFERVPNVPLEEIEEKYANGGKVQPDDGESRVKDERDPKVDRDKLEQPSATLVVCWEMESDEEVEVARPNKLPPSQWYMACDTCDYSEEDLRDQPDYPDGSTLPETMACPKCGETPEGNPAGTLHRIEVDTEVGTVPAYTGKRRRFVFAPCSPEAGYLEDGDWPAGLTRFPGDMYVPDPFPLEPFGNSQTFLNMDMQSLKNATVADGFTQMQRNRDLLLVREESIWDAQHEPYQFDGTGDFVAYVSTYDDLQGMKHVQGSGLNQAFGLWFQTIDGELNKHRGIGQASLSPEQMKGVQVGTIARSIETGDVPLDERLRIFREFEERVFNRAFELICGNWTSAQWVDVAGPTGQTVARLFDPMNQPKMRLRVHAAPNLDSVDIEKMKALSEMAKAGSPTLMRYIGNEAHLPPSMVEEVINEVTAAMQPAAPGLPGLPNGVSPAGGANGVPPMPPETPAMRMAAV